MAEASRLRIFASAWDRGKRTSRHHEGHRALPARDLGASYGREATYRYRSSAQLTRRVNSPAPPATSPRNTRLRLSPRGRTLRGEVVSGARVNRRDTGERQVLRGAA